MLGGKCLRIAKFAISNNRIAIEQIRNPNLKFQSDDWTINLYPFYPQIVKKKAKNIYEISSNSTVLAMSFISKKMDEETAWQNRKSTTFKFKELGLILGAHIGAKKQVIIQSESTMSKIPKTKVISFLDQPQNQTMRIKLDSLIQKPRQVDEPRVKQEQWSINMKIPYNEYRVFYKLIENSIYDLSGWRFMMEFQKQQQISKVEGMMSHNNQIDHLYN